MKIPNLKKNNKGLSLIELVVATVIIAIVTGPIVNSFIVSGRTANKARRYTEATDVAANVFSIVKTYGLGSIIDNYTTEEEDEVEPDPDAETEPAQEVEGEVDLHRLLDGNFSVAADEDGRGASIFSLKNGLGKYDVRLTYDTGTGADNDFITQINAKSMAQFASMDGNYSQPYSEQDQNPDIYSDTLFTLNGEEKKAVFVNGVRKDYSKRTREIDIDISMEPAVTDGENVIKASVEYNYFYDYQRLDMFNNWEQMRNVKLTAKSVQLFGDGKKVKNYTKGPNAGRNQLVTIYVMYYPDYDNVDTIVINNPDDVFCRVFLVKQWSLEKAGTDWVRLPEAELQIKEAAYRPHIREYRSINNNKEKIIKDCLLYTNAGLSLISDLPVHGMTYSVIIDNFGQYIYRNTDPAWEKITNGYLVHRDQFDRVSKIRVEVYAEGDLSKEDGLPVAGAKPIYSTLESIALIGG